MNALIATVFFAVLLCTSLINSFANSCQSSKILELKKIWYEAEYLVKEKDDKILGSQRKHE